MFTSVLVANRGEIAVRVIRTLHRLGVRSVLAAALPDRTSLAARMASEVLVLPGTSAGDTYLNIAALINAAQRSGCDALHPGYGFLSESPALARACEAAGIVFVGPTPAALEALGDKVSARNLAQRLGVPVIPGWHHDTGDDEAVAVAAGQLGLPVMLKARAGGGGRGMRRITSPGGLRDTIAGARREAASSFGDGSLFLEKLLVGAHHVEVQVVADTHGNVLHFGERECSVQRRHQKLIEESPSPVLDQPLRERLFADAVRLCAAANYHNAGTVEFLVAPDPPGGSPPYYLLEVNPRLQVEHPVTEAVTGFDLVELQLRVAAGEPLPVTQSAIVSRGAAIELRLNAESPARDFEPSPGRITHLSFPPGVRVDTGYAPGDSVPAQFDSLFAKLVVHAPGRTAAVAAALDALAAFEVGGLATNARLLAHIAGHNDFAAGRVAVDWLDRQLPGLLASATPGAGAIAAAASAFALAPPVPDPFAGAGWLGAGPATLWLWDGETTHEVGLRLTGTDGVAYVAGSQLPVAGHRGAIGLAVDVSGVPWSVVRVAARRVRVQSFSGVFTFDLAGPPPLPRAARAAVGSGAHTIAAPLAGTIAAVHAAAGQPVAPGDLLITLEAMKMEHRIVAGEHAMVAAVLVSEGDVVSRGDPLVELAAAKSPA